MEGGGDGAVEGAADVRSWARVTPGVTSTKSTLTSLTDRAVTPGVTTVFGSYFVTFFSSKYDLSLSE